MKLLLVPLLFLAVTCAAYADTPEIVGAWQLTAFVNIVDGERVYPFGKNPQGFFTYTASGRLTIQIQNESPPAAWRSLNTASEDEGRGDASPWYVGYFGRYSVDPDAGEVIHHVEGGTLLHYIGTDQRRPFQLDGDSLFIGERGVWERELVRVD